METKSFNLDEVRKLMILAVVNNWQDYSLLKTKEWVEERLQSLSHNPVEQLPQLEKTKPFIESNIRELIQEHDKEEISFSRMVEKMNEMAAKYYGEQLPKEESFDLDKYAEAIATRYCSRNTPSWHDFKLGVKKGFIIASEIKKQLHPAKEETFSYCQSEIEGGEMCDKQCSHCKEYYKTLEEETTSQSFKKGDLVEVTKCIIGHKFEIGEIVTVIQGEGDIWLCSNDNGVKWYLKDDEGIVITREEATRIKNWNQFSLTDEYKNCPSKDLLMRYYVFWLKDNFNPPTPKK